MCWSCNPFCGNCKPPKPRPKICPNCKTLNMDDPDEPVKCKKCGADLPMRPPIEPVHCLFSDTICKTPCRKHKEPPKDGVPRPCKYNPQSQVSG